MEFAARCDVSQLIAFTLMFIQRQQERRRRKREMIRDDKENTVETTKIRTKEDKKKETVQVNDSLVQTISLRRKDISLCVCVCVCVMCCFSFSKESQTKLVFAKIEPCAMGTCTFLNG